MKKALLLVLVTEFLMSITFAQVVFIPAKPQIGETVEFSYDPRGGKLAKEPVLKASILFFDNKTTSKPTSVPIPVKKEGNYWQGSFEMSSDEEAAGALLIFKDLTGKIIDTNLGKGYSVLRHDGVGTPLPKSRAALSIALNNATKNPALKLSPDKLYQISLFEQEFASNPHLKSTHLGYYLTALSESKSGDYKEKINRELEELIASQPELKLSKLMLIVLNYKQIGEYEKAEVYAKKIRDLEPKGVYVEMEYVEKIMKETDNDKKLGYFEAFEKNLSNSMFLTVVIPVVAYAYIEKRDSLNLKKVIERYEKKIPDPQSSTILSNVAKRMVQKGLDLELAKSYMVKVQNNGDISADMYRNYQFISGLIFEKQGKTGEAYQCYKNALTDNPEKSNTEINEHFVLMALKVNKKEEAKTAGEIYVKAGKANDRIKSALKELYIASYGTNGVDSYISNLENTAKTKQKEDLLKEIISEPAPNFILKDIKGEIINLENLRGKIVVIDFWATWCGPCIQSFPGMQRAQKKYEDNPNVKFLFINTQEHGNNFESKVTDFIAKNKYDTFIVPLDLDGKVSATYGINSIPTKVIIDAKGNIRYKSVGFNGNVNALENEISNIIEIIADTPRE